MNDVVNEFILAFDWLNQLRAAENEARHTVDSHRPRKTSRQFANPINTMALAHCGEKFEEPISLFCFDLVGRRVGVFGLVLKSGFMRRGFWDVEEAPYVHFFGQVVFRQPDEVIAANIEIIGFLWSVIPCAKNKVSLDLPPEFFGVRFNRG